MIITYLISFFIGLGVFFFITKFGLLIRIAVALMVFLIPSILFTFWIGQIGDKPLPGAITVTPNKNHDTKQK